MSGKWQRTLASGLIGSALLTGVSFGADGRMQTQKSTASRRVASTPGPRTVDFKTERTDSWLCTYISPFFCSSIPSVAQSPQTTSSRRGRR